MSAPVIDDLDRQLIDILSSDARVSNRKIAADLGVTEGTVRGRIKRLQQDRLIAFTAITSFGLENSTKMAFIGVLAEVERVRDIAQTIAKQGVGVAVEQFQQQRKTFPAATGPNELNLLGYHYLTKNRLAEAVEVFKLNVALFPADGNGYDSLGEAYMVQGDTARAIQNYRRAVELDSTNTNAVEMLRKLEQK